MFNNVGKKIKTLAVIMFIIFMFISTAIAIATASLLITVDEGAIWIMLGLLAFLLIEVVGFLISWVSVLKQYAFGELVDTNQIQVRQNNTIIEILGGKTISASNPQIETIKHKKHYVNNNIGAMEIHLKNQEKEN